MQYSSSEIAWRRALHRMLRRKAYADGPLPRAHKKFLTDAGLDTQASMVDDAAFGRNLDGASGVNDVRRSRPRRLREDVERDSRLRQQECREASSKPWAAPGAMSRRATSWGRVPHRPPHRPPPRLTA